LFEGISKKYPDAILFGVQNFLASWLQLSSSSINEILVAVSKRCWWFMS